MQDKRMNGKTMQCCIIHIFQDFFPRCLKITKITEKVSLNIASEASYVYTLSVKIS